LKNSKSKTNHLLYHIRRLQKSTRTLNVSIPFNFASLLKWQKGDLMKISLVSDPAEGNRLMLEKLRFKELDWEQQDYEFLDRQNREGESLQ
jgi:hypothetical protein